MQQLSSDFEFGSGDQTQLRYTRDTKIKRLCHVKHYAKFKQTLFPHWTS